MTKISKDKEISQRAPFGLAGQAKPRHFREMLGALWENKDQLPYLWNILTHGVCDACSPGPYGLNVHNGIHLCMTRLKQLRLNTVGALDLAAMGDIASLRRLKPAMLRNLGRLPYPMIRRKGDRGFARLGWDEAIGTIQKSIRDTTPREMAFFATSDGLTNEVYYVFQKLARVLGTNNVDLDPPLRDASILSGLKSTLGIGAPTCSLEDLIGTDLLIIFGSDPANDQPVMTKYLQLAKKSRTRIIVVNSIKENRRRRHWVPFVAMRSLFATQLTDECYQVRVDGEIAFINGVLKSLIASNRIDSTFVHKHTAGFGGLKNALEQQPWEMLEQRSGLARGLMQRCADIYGQARNAVFVYSMGSTRQELGVEKLQAIVNLALARGMLGREKCGIMPILSHSSVQGGGDCGSEPDKFPGGFAVNEENARRFSNLWHHPVPSNPGLELPQMIEAAHEEKIKFLYSIGGNPMETLPDADFVGAALRKIPLRVHQDIVLNTSMLLDADQAVVLLPGQTRYEQRTGGTTTNTERKIHFTPEITGHLIGETRPGWEIPVLIGRASMSNGDKLFPFENTQSIREEMAKVMPLYQGIEKLNEAADHFQWGGPFLFKDGFTSMPGQRARFTVFDPPDIASARART